MARLVFFVAAMAIWWFSMAAAHNASPPEPPPNCSYGARGMRYCRSYLQNGSDVVQPGKGCCFVTATVYFISPQCLCEITKPSVVNVPVNATRVSALPLLCRLPTGPLLCNDTASPPSATPSPLCPGTPSPLLPPIPITHPPATAPSSSVSAPPSNAPESPVAAPPSDAPESSIAAPPSDAPESSVAAPPSDAPESSIATPPSWADAPAFSPISDAPAVAPAVPPFSSDALKLATSLVILLANLALASALFCI